MTTSAEVKAIPFCRLHQQHGHIGVDIEIAAADDLAFDVKILLAMTGSPSPAVVGKGQVRKRGQFMLQQDAARKHWEVEVAADRKRRGTPEKRP